MDVGEYYQSNLEKVICLTTSDWKVALKKCKDHIKWKLKQKTLYGAHSGSNLGADPIDHYLGLAYEKILFGEWEWKNEHTLVEQMIRIADSYISKSVEKTTTQKAESFKLTYRDIEQEFYALSDNEITSVDIDDYDIKVKALEKAIDGDEELEFLWEGLKEGKKRVEIAELLNITPKQLDKLREKLFRRVRNEQQAQVK